MPAKFENNEDLKMWAFPMENQQMWDLEEFKNSWGLQNVSISNGNIKKMKSKQNQQI